MANTESRFTRLKNYLKGLILTARFEKAVKKSIVRKEIKILNPEHGNRKRFDIPKGCKAWIYDIENRHLDFIDHTDREAMKTFFTDLKQTEFKDRFLIIRAINRKNALKKVDRFHELNPHR